MSDELTPEHEDAVRRLLADARHTEPIPAEVAARLDDVLADLRPEPVETPVVDLATARNRRRNVGRLLVAAAAVIVAGVGVGQVVGGSPSSDDSSAGGGSTALEQPPDREQSAGADAAAPEAVATQVPLQLSGDDLATQVETQLDQLPADVRSSALAGEAPALEEPSFSCPLTIPRTDGTRVVPAYVDGVPALLALAPGEGDNRARAARLVDCASGEDLATFEVTLP